MCKHKHINDIRENYLKMEKELVTQLNYEISIHPGTLGANREEIWADFFRRIVPKKFNVERSVFIIDSKGNASKEVDIAIYDEQYTPYIFNYGCIKFIPVEAVAVAIQCKSKKCDKENLAEWVKSVENLETSPDSIVRLVNHVHMREIKNSSTQTATKPIKILCYIPKEKTSTDDSYGRDEFDIIIEAYQNNKTNVENRKYSDYDGNLKITFKDENLEEVLHKYNQADKSNKNIEKKEISLKERKIEDYKVKLEEKEYSLLSFIFQFNQMLMIINNPMFFPHKAYVDMFNEKK